MKPVFLLAPYWMGDFSPARAALFRHNWRLLATSPLEGSPTYRMGKLAAVLAEEVANIRSKDDFPVAIIGDCTLSIGMVAALQRESPDFHLIWFDAHGDFNTLATTPSGFVGGMPLAMICGRGEQTIVKEAGAIVHPETDIILTDGRDLDPEEAVAVANSVITHLSDMSQLLTWPLPDKPIYIHFDVDVLPLDELSAVSYPASGGPALDTVAQALARLARTGRVTALSVTLWHPEKDNDGRAEPVVMGLVEHFLKNLP
jgi:arginase